MKKIVYDDFSTIYWNEDDSYKKGKKEGIVVTKLFLVFFEIVFL